MPITAIPKGVELRKITAVQKRALDDLITKERGSSALTTALVVGIPSIIAGSAVLAYVFKEEAKEWFEKQEEKVKDVVKDVVVKTGETIVETIIETGNRVFRNTPTTPEQYGGSTLSRCTRWAVDATENLARVQKGNLTKTETAGLAANLKYIISNMKSEGCSRPSAISVAQWG
jgi:type IV secretory pathway TrbL component